MARTGQQLVRILSVTRHPEHAELEYMVLASGLGEGEEGGSCNRFMITNWFPKPPGPDESEDMGFVLVGCAEGLFDGPGGQDPDIGGHTAFPGVGGGTEGGTWVGAVWDEANGTIAVFRGTSGRYETVAAEPRVWVSADGGLTWTEHDPTAAWGMWPPAETISDQRFTAFMRQAASPDGVILAVLWFGEFSYSLDGGRTWSNAVIPTEIAGGLSEFPQHQTVRFGGDGRFAWAGDDLWRAVGHPPTDFERSLKIEDLEIDWPFAVGAAPHMWLVAGRSVGDGAVQRCTEADLDPSGWETVARRVVSSQFEADVYESEGPQTLPFFVAVGGISWFNRAGGGGRWWLYNTDQALVYSDDDGLTWSKALCDHADADGDQTIHPFFDHRGAVTGAPAEFTSTKPRVTAMVQSPSNPEHLLAVGRTYTQSGITNRFAVYAVSTDGGDTWGPVEQLPISAVTGGAGSVGAILPITVASLFP